MIRVLKHFFQHRYLHCHQGKSIFFQIYMYTTPLEISFQDLEEDDRASITLSLAQVVQRFSSLSPLLSSLSSQSPLGRIWQIDHHLNQSHCFHSGMFFRENTVLTKALTPKTLLAPMFAWLAGRRYRHDQELLNHSCISWSPCLLDWQVTVTTTNTLFFKPLMWLFCFYHDVHHTFRIERVVIMIIPSWP